MGLRSRLERSRLLAPKGEAEAWTGLYLSSKAASRRASRMFSSGSHVLYLEGFRKKGRQSRGRGESGGRVSVYNFSPGIVLYFDIKGKKRKKETSRITVWA